MHELLINMAWTVHEVTIFVGIKSMKYGPKFPNFMGAARENLSCFEHEHEHVHAQEPWTIFDWDVVKRKRKIKRNLFGYLLTFTKYCYYCVEILFAGMEVYCDFWFSPWFYFTPSYNGSTLKVHINTCSKNNKKKENIYLNVMFEIVIYSVLTSLLK